MVRRSHGAVTLNETDRVDAVSESTEPIEPRRIRFGGRRLPLPQSRALRIALGGALVLGGVVGFLPILGFWMVPLGLFVLSVDLL